MQNWTERFLVFFFFAGLGWWIAPADIENRTLSSLTIGDIGSLLFACGLIYLGLSAFNDE